MFLSRGSPALCLPFFLLLSPDPFRYWNVDGGREPRRDVNERRTIKPEGRPDNEASTDLESTMSVQDHVVLVAEINWRRLGDRRTAGLGLAAVRHH